MNEEISKGKSALLVVFGAILAVSIGNLLLENFMNNTETSISKLISYFLIHIILMYCIYTGRQWAKTTLSAFLVFGILVSIISIFMSSTNLIMVVQLLSLVLVYGFSTYLLNTNVSIEEFMKYQQSKLQEKTESA